MAKDSKFYEYKELSAIFGRSIRTLKAWKRNGQIPPPTKIIAGNPFWEKTAFDAWMNGGKMTEQTIFDRVIYTLFALAAFAFALLIVLQVVRCTPVPNDAGYYGEAHYRAVHALNVEEP